MSSSSGITKSHVGSLYENVTPSSEYYYGNCGSGQQGFFYILSNFYFHPGLSVRTSFSHNICLLGYRALAISHETSILAKHENMKLLPKITHKGNILSKCLGLGSLKLAFTTRNRFYVSWSRVLLSSYTHPTRKSMREGVLILFTPTFRRNNESLAG